MNYQEFLQRFKYQDSPYAQQAFQEQFGGAPPEFNYASGSRIGEPSSPGKVWGIPSGHASAAGQGGMTEEYAQELERRNFPLPEDYEAPNLGLSSPIVRDRSGQFINQYNDDLPNSQAPESFYRNQEDFLNADNSGVLPGGSPASYQGGGLTGEGTDPWDMPKPFVYNDPARPHPPPEVFSSHPFFEPGETNISQGPGLLTKATDYSGIESGAEAGLSAAEIAAQSEQALAAGEAGLEAIEAAEAAGSGWGGPATYAANQALNLIPTRDRDKKVTPLGDEGSVSGILKGTGKGALTGATIGSYFGPKGTLVGGVVGGGVGLIGGAQGYFDSTSAPIMNMSRIKRRGGGMQGGLLGGGSMYG